MLGGVCATILLTSVLVELPLFVDSADAGASIGGSVVFGMVEEFVELPLSLDTSVVFGMVEEFVELPLSLDTLDVESLFAG